MTPQYRGSPRLSFPLLLLCATSHILFAAIRPSFWLERSSWDATDIVLVQGADRGGSFEVIESWTGSLRPRDYVEVRELTPDSSAIPIPLLSKSGLVPQTEAGPLLEIPSQPLGSRMILFLRRARTEALPSSRANPAAPQEWEPTGWDYKSSVVWISGERLFVFHQLNPGPSVLVTEGISLPELRSRVASIRAIRMDLDEVVTLDDGGSRAKRLKPYARSDIVFVRQFAVKALGEGGPAAVMTIREMLDDPAYAIEADDLIRAYVAAGGEAVGSDLNDRLREELRFWQVTGRSLKRGWWNRAKGNEALRGRYVVSIGLVLALQKVHCADALATAREFSRFWRSLAQLNDPSGIDRIAVECDRLASQFDR